METSEQFAPRSEQHRHRVPGDQRRAQLLEAAIRVFSRAGFSGTKTKDIAAEAHVNEAILFRHFPSKDELYAAILEAGSADDWVRSVAEAAETAKDDPVLFVREYVKRSLAWYRRRPDLGRLILYSALEKHELAHIFRDKQIMPVLDVMVRYIAERQAEARFTNKVSAEAAARVLFSAVAHEGLKIVLLRGADTGINDDQLADVITEITLNGLKQTAS
jgi:AcrR family transcriptional regulator